MAKIIITLPEDMHKALRDVAKREDKVISALVRRSIAEFLSRTYGIDVDHAMQWGRTREDGDEEKE